MLLLRSNKAKDKVVIEIKMPSLMPELVQLPNRSKKYTLYILSENLQCQS
eukprot:m.132265 g.132265  ORF g.132265 m.132265 type:complete len:50 (+) comp14642_c1_seq4:4034-4183(+)